MDERRWKSRGVWQCKVGVDRDIALPYGSDLLMRHAIRAAFRDVAGIEADFVFSGWNADLTEGERAVVEQLKAAAPTSSPQAVVEEGADDE